MDITSDFIRKVLRRAKIDPKYEDVLTNPTSIDIYQTAFTSNTVNPEKNYELYEFLGDSLANTALMIYFNDVFPQLHCPKSVKIYSRLKIVHASKESFSKIGKDLGFWPYIKYDANVAAEKTMLKKTNESLLEDVFEAFVGATHIILKNKFGIVGVGVAAQLIYNFIAAIFDAKEISFAPEDLYDAKTRLKELFEVKKNVRNPLAEQFGAPRYIDSLPPSTNVTLRFSKNHSLYFNGTGNSKQQAHKMAAQQAIDYFADQGFQTEKRFNMLCT